MDRPCKAKCISILNASIKFDCRDRNTGIWDEVSVCVTGVS